MLITASHRAELDSYNNRIDLCAVMPIAFFAMYICFRNAVRAYKTFGKVTFGCGDDFAKFINKYK